LIDFFSSKPPSLPLNFPFRWFFFLSPVHVLFPELASQSLQPPQPFSRPPPSPDSPNIYIGMSVLALCSLSPFSLRCFPYFLPLNLSAGQFCRLKARCFSRLFFPPLCKKIPGEWLRSFIDSSPRHVPFFVRLSSNQIPISYLR